MALEACAMPIPIGWFQIGWSPEIPTGEVRPIQFCGHDLVAYRGEAGALHVLDGHCLHLGAHLGRGGRVCGDELECPFHEWRWGADGRNTHVPDLDRPNGSARLRAWPVDERNGCIYVWHHPGGGEPLWPVVDVFLDLPGRAADDDETKSADAAAALPQDIEIWQHQRFVERPLLAPYERGLAELRSWARAFDPVAKSPTRDAYPIEGAPRPENEGVTA